MGLLMFNEIKGRDLLRTLALSGLGLVIISLYLYLRGSLTSTMFEVVLGVVIAAAVFDTFWLNAKRTRLRSIPEEPISIAEVRERQVKLSQKIVLLVGAIVVAGLAIQFLLQLRP